MPAKRFPTKSPSLTIKDFTDIRGAYQKLRDLVRSLEDFRKTVLISTNDHADRIDPTSGSGAPGTTPSDVGLLYLDTTAEDMYISVGTVDSADWKKITP